MSDSTILREYLVSLGFKVSAPEAKKFDQGLEKWDKRATALSRSLFGVGVAAQAMVTQFAFSMEKLYYASRRTDSAVGSIQALDYGFRKVGGSSETIRGSLEALARNLRSNPGLTGLLESLGVPVKGRDKADVLTDLVGQLKKMPFYVAERFANLFGIDPDTLFMLQDGLDEMKKAQAERKQMAAEMGVDTEAAALAGKEYANQWREIAEYAGLFRDALAMGMLPKLMEVAGVTKELLKDWTAIAQMDFGSFWDKLKEGLGIKAPGGGVKLTADARQRLGLPQDDQKPGLGGKNFLTSNINDYADASKAPTTAPGASTAPSPAQPPTLGWMERLKRWGKPAYKNAAEDAKNPVVATGPAVSVGPIPSGVRVDGAMPVNSKAPSAADGSADALFRRLEQQYALPAGLLDRVWKAESNRGDPRFMQSSAGAKGHFQFMDPTAKQYGVKDPNDLAQSAEGAAKYYADLLKKYDGDAAKAAAAFNWGPGNLDRYGLGAAPEETRKYIEKVAPPQLNQTNNITVTGAAQPQESARAVQSAMEDVNADAIRNFTPKVQ
jgi:hypothetical protein